MAQKTGKTSSAAWHDAISTWEKSVNSVANATMANDEFSGAMNQAMKLALIIQQSMGSAMAVYLSTLNLPSKTEVAALGERMQLIESRLEHLTLLIGRLAATGAATTDAVSPANRAGPPRTKRPPSQTNRAAS